MVSFSVKNERKFCATLGNELPSQSRGLEKEIHHEAISHGNVKSSHAMQNSKEQQFQGKFGALSGFFCLHTIYHFKAREVRSPMLQTICKSKFNEEVMTIWRQLRKTKRNFASPFPDAKIFALTFPDAKIFALTFPDAKIFALTFSNVKIFALPFSNVKFFASPFSDAKM